MRIVSSGVLVVVMSLLLTAPTAQAQVQAQAINPAEAWRAFAAGLAAGTELHVKLRNGQSFSATTIEARPDALVLQPRTRVPVDIVAIPYTDITAMRRQEPGRTSAGKAVAIGVASGAGTFLAILLALLATVD